MKQSIEEKTIRSLRVHYYGSYVLLGSLFLFVFFRSKRFSETPQPLNMALQQYGILITLAAIPLALKTFANMIKRKRDKERTTQETITVYKKAFFLRLYLLDCVILATSYCMPFLTIKTMHGSRLFFFLHCFSANHLIKNLKN